MIKSDNIVIFEHPLIQHKISLLRDKATGTNEFRKLVDEIAMLEGFEALSDLPVEDVEIETPIEKCMTPMISGRKLAVVPILRAGLGMVSGILALVPNAKVGHIGMYRDEETHQPQEYYCKLPNPIEERLIVVCDPMLATGGSAIDAIDQIKKHGGRNVSLLRRRDLRSFIRHIRMCRSMLVILTDSSTRMHISVRVLVMPVIVSLVRNNHLILIETMLSIALLLSSFCSPAAYIRQAFVRLPF